MASRYSYIEIGDVCWRQILAENCHQHLYSFFLTKNHAGILFKNLNYTVLDRTNEFFYMNITVDLLWDNRVDPNTKLWKHKTRRSARTKEDFEVRSIYKYPEYRLNDNPAIIMNHRLNMFDLVEHSESTSSKTNSFYPNILMSMITSTQELVSDSLRRISDIFSPRKDEVNEKEYEVNDKEDEINERIPRWHPTKLDKIVDFESVLRAMRQEYQEN